MIFDFSALMDLSWLDRIACADMEGELFFVEAGHVIDEATLDVCRRCPVRVNCIEHAYRLNCTSGYFGGLSPGQRRQLTLSEALAVVTGDAPPDVGEEPLEAPAC